MKKWNGLFLEGRFVSREPHERVIKFANILKERKKQRVYDLGCGAGRHLGYLAKRGFVLAGTDISGIALNLAREWLEREGLTADLRKSDMTTAPYPDSSFDAVISINVIYHNTFKNMCTVIGEIHRVMRRGGLALLTLQSKRSYKYGRGREIELGTFVADDGNEIGIPHHFTDREELERLLEAFTVLEVTLDEFVDEQARRNSHWEVMIEKAG